MMSSWLDTFNSAVEGLQLSCRSGAGLSSADVLEVLGLARHILSKLLPALTAFRYRIKAVLLKEKTVKQHAFLTLNTYIEQLQKKQGASLKNGYSSQVVSFLQKSAELMELAKQVQHQQVSVGSCAEALQSVLGVLSASLSSASNDCYEVHMVLLSDLSKPLGCKNFVPLDLILEQRINGLHMDTEISVELTSYFHEGRVMSKARVVEARIGEDADIYLFSKAYNARCNSSIFGAKASADVGDGLSGSLREDQRKRKHSVESDDDAEKLRSSCSSETESKKSASNESTNVLFPLRGSPEECYNSSDEEIDCSVDDFSDTDILMSDKSLIDDDFQWEEETEVIDDSSDKDESDSPECVKDSDIEPENDSLHAAKEMKSSNISLKQENSSNKTYSTRSTNGKLYSSKGKLALSERVYDANGRQECFDTIGKEVRNRRHLQFKSYICYICDSATFETCESLCDHIRRDHYVNRYGSWYLYCTKCSNRYFTKASKFNLPWGIMDTVTSHFTHLLSSHRIDIPSFIESFNCTKCSYHTAVPEYLYKHVKKMHTAKVFASANDSNEQAGDDALKKDETNSGDRIAIKTEPAWGNFAKDLPNSSKKGKSRSQSEDEKCHSPKRNFKSGCIEEIASLDDLRCSVSRNSFDSMVCGKDSEGENGSNESACSLSSSEIKSDTDLSLEQSPTCSAARLTGLGSVSGCFDQFFCYLCKDRRVALKSLDSLLLHCQENHLYHRFNNKTTHAALKCPHCRYTACLVSTNLRRKIDLLEMLGYLADHFVFEHNLAWTGFKVRLYCRDSQCTFIGSTLKGVVEHERQCHLGYSKTRSQHVRTLTLLSDCKYVMNLSMNQLYQLT